MATIRDYLDIADASYDGNLERHVSPRWRVRKSEKATWYGNGFQGAVFESHDEVIVAFSGTKGGPMTAPISQNSANARIAALVIPNMAGSAKNLVQWAEQNCDGKPVSIVGHSLGGALAQVVGAWSGRPFVSLNGPGMKAHLEASAFNVFKPHQMARSIKARRKPDPVGLCLNVRGDFVGAYGKGHVGEVLELMPDTGEATHSIDAIRDALPDEDLAKQPWMLSASWPVTRTSDTVPKLGNVPSSGPSFTELIVQHPVFRPSAGRTNSGGAGSRGGTQTSAVQPTLRPLAQRVQPPAQFAEPANLDQEHDRLIDAVDRRVDRSGEGTGEDEPVPPSADPAKTMPPEDRRMEDGAWLTSVTGIPPESLEGRIVEPTRTDGSRF